METAAAPVLSLAPALWVVFFVAVVIAVGFGILLAYHWVRFSASTFATIITISAYAGACFFILSSMLLALSFF